MCDDHCYDMADILLGFCNIDSVFEYYGAFLYSVVLSMYKQNPTFVIKILNKIKNPKHIFGLQKQCIYIMSDNAKQFKLYIDTNFTDELNEYINGDEYNSRSTGI